MCLMCSDAVTIFPMLKVSYNKYFCYLCIIKRYIEYGKEHNGD